MYCEYAVPRAAHRFAVILGIRRMEVFSCAFLQGRTRGDHGEECTAVVILRLPPIYSIAQCKGRLKQLFGVIHPRASGVQK